MDSSTVSKHRTIPNIARSTSIFWLVFIGNQDQVRGIGIPPGPRPPNTEVGKKCDDRKRLASIPADPDPELRLATLSETRETVPSDTLTRCW
jgi:hypothetical protein